MLKYRPSSQVTSDEYEKAYHKWVQSTNIEHVLSLLNLGAKAFDNTKIHVNQEILIGTKPVECWRQVDCLITYSENGKEYGIIIDCKNVDKVGYPDFEQMFILDAVPELKRYILLTNGTISEPQTVWIKSLPSFKDKANCIYLPANKMSGPTSYKENFKESLKKWENSGLSYDLTDVIEGYTKHSVSFKDNTVNILELEFTADLNFLSGEAELISFYSSNKKIQNQLEEKKYQLKIIYEYGRDGQQDIYVQIEIFGLHSDKNHENYSKTLKTYLGSI